MLKHYLKIALRHLLRHKVYSLINIGGTAIGLASCILIFLYVQDEAGYDRYHANFNRVYRVVNERTLNGATSQVAATPAPWAPILQKDYPEIESYARFYPAPGRWLVSHENKNFFEERFFAADSSVFRVFSWKLLAGDPQTALREPYSMVVTPQFAQKYFGSAEAINQTLVVNDSIAFKITAVMQNAPKNSHFTFDFLISFSTLPKMFGEWMVNHMRGPVLYAYLLMPENYHPGQFQPKLNAFIEKYVAEGARARNLVITPRLQPLRDIHLFSNLEGEIAPQGNSTTLYIFAAIAGLILLMACINFINLSTARATLRAREVGVRKVVGSNRGGLIRQFIGESLVVGVAAMSLALVLVELLLPYLNLLSGKALSLRLFENPQFAFILVAITGTVGLLAGIYPAFVLSAFSPATVLKGMTPFGAGGKLSWLRQAFVVFQFVISIALIIGTAVIFKQLYFLKTQKLGFDKEQIAVIPLHADQLLRQARLIKNELARSPAIENISMTTGVPAIAVGGDFVRPENAPIDQNVVTQILQVDEAFLPTFDLELMAGSNFNAVSTWLQRVDFIINQTAVKQFGFGSPENALGKRLTVDVDYTATVIGVVKDFHTASLREQVAPLLLGNFMQPRFLAVRIKRGEIPTALGFMQSAWSKLFPTTPFEYSFLDQEFARLYQSEEQLGKIVGQFSFLAIFIAMLGLFGLSSFMTQQRTKEIGIRKVLGATIANILALFSKEFVWLVLMANLLAWPLAYYAMNQWLQEFAYRINIGWWIFTLAGGMALLIALLTVSTQAIKAALANPVEALRYE